MTKQTIKEYIEDLEMENSVLRRKIQKLEKDLEEARIWDKRDLDEIIGKKEETEPVVFANSIASKKSLGYQNFMEQYREYRKLQKETNTAKEIELDTRALDNLKKWVNERKSAT